MSVADLGACIKEVRPSHLLDITYTDPRLQKNGNKEAFGVMAWQWSHANADWVAPLANVFN